jgi:hypothetical protein
MPEPTVNSGRGIVYTFLRFLILGISCLAIWWVGKWFCGAVGAPAIVLTVWTGILILVGLIVFLDFLMGLIGRPFLPNW